MLDNWLISKKNIIVKFGRRKIGFYDSKGSLSLPNIIEPNFELLQKLIFCPKPNSQPHEKPYSWQTQDSSFHL